MPYSIIRIDKGNNRSGGNTHGWQVRVGESLKLGYHSKLFSDLKHGSSCDALSNAQDYLNDYLSKHPELNISDPRPSFNKQGTVSKHNRSGRNGIHRSRNRDKHGRYYYYWAASFTIDRLGRERLNLSQRFYILKHGEFGARQMAIEFREMWEEAAAQGPDAVVQFFEDYYDGVL